MADPDDAPPGFDALRRPDAPVSWTDRLAEALAARGWTVGRAAVAGLAVLVVAAVGWQLLRPPSAPVEAGLPFAATGSAGTTASGVGGGEPAGTGADARSGDTTSSTAGGELVVQAAGAVIRPGLYHLPSGARLDDLVRAAGGLAPDADGDRINLAAPVVDGTRVFVPRQGQDPPQVVAGATSGGAPDAAGGDPTAPAAPVDLNQATAEQLDSLPGVGPATAAAILQYRTAHGGFRSVDELLDVRGIGEAKLAQLRDLVRV